MLAWIRALARRLRLGNLAPTTEVDEFFDLDVPIVDHRRLDDGRQIVRLRGDSLGRSIGLDVEIHESWERQWLDDSIPVFWGKVSYRSVGPESDRLLEVLAAGYGVPLPRPRMANVTHFTAVSLSGDPRQLPERPVRMKLFFDRPEPARYAEIYTNLDVRLRLAEVHEKDQEYRLPLLRALAIATP